MKTACVKFSVLNYQEIKNIIKTGSTKNRHMFNRYEKNIPLTISRKEGLGQILKMRLRCCSKFWEVGLCPDPPLVSMLNLFTKTFCDMKYKRKFTKRTLYVSITVKYSAEF